MCASCASTSGPCPLLASRQASRRSPMCRKWLVALVCLCLLGNIWQSQQGPLLTRSLTHALKQRSANLSAGGGTLCSASGSQAKSGWAPPRTHGSPKPYSTSGHGEAIPANQPNKKPTTRQTNKSTYTNNNPKPKEGKTKQGQHRPTNCSMVFRPISIRLQQPRRAKHSKIIYDSTNLGWAASHVLEYTVSSTAIMYVC